MRSTTMKARAPGKCSNHNRTSQGQRQVKNAQINLIIIQVVLSSEPVIEGKCKIVIALEHYRKWIRGTLLVLRTMLLLCHSVALQIKKLQRTQRTIQNNVACARLDQ